MSNFPKPKQARIWRIVRDAGKNGTVLSRVAARAPEFDTKVVSNLLYLLKTGGFVQQLDRLGAYYVDADCRVPAGEDSHLGPGWDEPEEMPDKVAAPATPRQSTSEAPHLQSALTAWPEPTATKRTAKAKNDAPAPDPVNLRSFKAALASDAKLSLHLKTGREIELDAEDTRRLLTYIGCLAGTDLCHILPKS